MMGEGVAEDSPWGIAFARSGSLWCAALGETSRAAAAGVPLYGPAACGRFGVGPRPGGLAVCVAFGRRTWRVVRVGLVRPQDAVAPPLGRDDGAFRNYGLRRRRLALAAPRATAGTPT